MRVRRFVRATRTASEESAARCGAVLRKMKPVVRGTVVRVNGMTKHAKRFASMTSCQRSPVRSPVASITPQPAPGRRSCQTGRPVFAGECVKRAGPVQHRVAHAQHVHARSAGQLSRHRTATSEDIKWASRAYAATSVQRAAGARCRSAYRYRAIAKTKQPRRIQMLRDRLQDRADSRNVKSAKQRRLPSRCGLSDQSCRCGRCVAEPLDGMPWADCVDRRTPARHMTGQRDANVAQRRRRHEPGRQRASVLPPTLASMSGPPLPPSSAAGSSAGASTATPR